MDLKVWSAIIVAVIMVCGTIFVAIKSSSTSLERINIENAKDITTQWQTLNGTLRTEMDAKFITMQKEIDSVKKENKEIKEKFAKRELFLESEIEVRDAKIVKLEIENAKIVILEKENIDLKTQLAAYIT